METTDHDYSRGLQPKLHSVWKAPQKRAAFVAVHDGELPGIAFDLLQTIGDGIEKFRA